MSNPAWESDPTSRHQYRWWDGEKWTEHVADDGIQSLDPLDSDDNSQARRDMGSQPPLGSGGATDQGSLGQQVQLASRMARFGGRLIDVVIFWALLVGVLLILHFNDIRPMPVDEMDSIDAQEAYQESVDEVVWAIIATWAVYELVLTATRGQTLGKMATRTRVIRADEVLRPDWDRGPGWSKSFVRLVLPIVLLLPVLLIPFYGALLAVVGYLSIIWDNNRQGWHDKAANTLVVAKP